MTNKDQRDRLYWEAKHPRALQMYQGRPAPNGKAYTMDVRRFVWPEDWTLDKIVAGGLYDTDPDKAAWNCQRHVVRSIRYVADTKIGRSEYWLFPVETIAMGAGDCEDGAILMASLIANCVPYEHQWRVRVVAGWVDAGTNAEQGGHAYCVWCRTSDNQWVILDWCYVEDSVLPVIDKPLAKDVRMYRDIWFSFNSQWAWSHVNLDCAGRLHTQRRAA
jgi:hypothetical protein